MAWKIVLILGVIAVLGLGVFLYMRFSENDTASETESANAALKPVHRTKDDIRAAFKRRFDATRKDAIPYPDMKERRGFPKPSGYVPGIMQASAKASSDLDGKLGAAKRNDAMSERLHKEIKTRLASNAAFREARIERVDCISTYCRTILGYSNQDGMRMLLRGMPREGLFADRYEFSYTRSKSNDTLVADLKSGSVPMETLHYVSNTPKPLPIDSNLQDAFKATEE